MPEGFFLKLPAGPACERCGGRTYIAHIHPHPDKPRYTRHTFECPRCYHLMKMTVAPRGKFPDEFVRVNQFVMNAELRIERQTVLVRRLRHQGRDTTRAEALLEVLHDSLDALRQYQDYVTRMLAKQGGAPASDDNAGPSSDSDSTALPAPRLSRRVG